jgi:hypothetical protein
MYKNKYLEMKNLVGGSSSDNQVISKNTTDEKKYSIEEIEKDLFYTIVVCCITNETHMKSEELDKLISKMNVNQLKNLTAEISKYKPSEYEDYKNFFLEKIKLIDFYINIKKKIFNINIKKQIEDHTNSTIEELVVSILNDYTKSNSEAFNSKDPTTYYFNLNVNIFSIHSQFMQVNKLISELNKVQLQTLKLKLKEKLPTTIAPTTMDKIIIFHIQKSIKLIDNLLKQSNNDQKYDHAVNIVNNILLINESYEFLF